VLVYNAAQTCSIWIYHKKNIFEWRLVDVGRFAIDKYIIGAPNPGMYSTAEGQILLAFNIGINV